MNIGLKKTSSVTHFDIFIDGQAIEGDINNDNQHKDFRYTTPNYKEDYSSKELRAIADELDRLNVGVRYND